jgi:transketolase
VGLEGRLLGLTRFGESAPGEAVFRYFGFTVEQVIETVNEMYK